MNYTVEQAHRLQGLAESLRDRVLTLKDIKEIVADEFPELGLHIGPCNREKAYSTLLDTAETIHHRFETGKTEVMETVVTTTSTRTYLYTRVSTVDQDTSNQKLEAKAAGFDIPEHRIVSETISGSSDTSLRPQFQKLLDRLEIGDTLVVSKLDRLGRDAINVQSTIKELGERGIRVVCLNLGNTDLTSPSGKMVVTVLSAVAQLERDLIIERTKAGLERAKTNGKVLGRPKATKTTEAVQRCKELQWTQRQTAEHLGITVRTVIRHWK